MKCQGKMKTKSFTHVLVSGYSRVEQKASNIKYCRERQIHRRREEKERIKER